LDERQAALDREMQARREEMRDALDLSGLKRQEEVARREGRQEEADALRARADALEDAQTRRDAMREAEGLPGAERDGYVQRRIEDAQRQRDAERKAAEEDRRLGRERSSAESNTAAEEIRARAAALRGSAREARRIREEAARREDEVAREEKRRGYIGQGFSGEQAKAMADKDVKVSQAERMLAEMSGYKGSIVASSLAQVGGGGNVSGTADASVRLQERMVKLLEEINDATRENVGGLR